MGQKNASPSKEQGKVLKKHGMNVHFWVVVKDLDRSMIVKHRITGEFKLISK